MPQLDLLIAVPLVLAIACALVGRARPSAARWIAAAAVGAQVALLVALSPSGVYSGSRVLGAHVPALGAVWQTAMDGLSAPLVVLTVLIGLAAVIASWDQSENPGSFFALLLLLQAAVTAVFLAENLLLFYVAWEAVLIPMYFIIGRWGSANRKHAATKYLLYSFAGGGVMLLGVILVLVQNSGSASIAALTQAISKTGGSAVVFWLFTLAFFVKIPGVPFHTWLPDAHTEAPTAGSIVLAGVLLKMGGYGLMRIAVPFAPIAFQSARPLLMALGLVGIVYGAAMALVQTDLKRLVAYSSVSHMGFVVLAIAVATPMALGAAMLAMVSHGFVAGMLFMLVGSLYARTHTRELGRFGGLGRVMPVWGVAFVFGAVASLGLPGLSGFPGEFVTLLESFKTFGWWTATATIGLVLSAAYNLRAVRRSVQGPVGDFAELPDLGAREIALAAAFALAIVVIGLQPMVVLGVAQRALTVLAGIAGGGR